MTGGGSLGPVTPLIAIAREWMRKNPHVHVSWIGTPKGPERMIVEEEGFDFYALSAPKLHRHKKWTWPFIPFLFCFSLFWSFFYLQKLRPNIVFTAGGYVSIPLVLAAWVLRIPSWVHQLDATPGIANKMMAPFAKRISVTWMESFDSFSEKKTLHVGSLVRGEIFHGNKEYVFEKYALDVAKPTVFVTGGGTGAQSINEVMAAIGSDIVKHANVIHLTGIGKMNVALESIAENYVAIELLGKDIANVYDVADVVVARAGMGTILEIAALRKPAILIPLANTDQLSNAQRFEEAEAGQVIHRLNGQILKQEILHLIEDRDRQVQYQRRLGELFTPHGEVKVVEKAMEMVKS